MTPVEEIGGMPIQGGEVAKSVDAVTALTLPTTAQRIGRGGVLQVMISIEAQSCRIRWDGTNPTAANGILLTSGIYTFRGERLIRALRFISAVAGCLINYQFSLGDNS